MNYAVKDVLYEGKTCQVKSALKDSTYYALKIFNATDEGNHAYAFTAAVHQKLPDHCNIMKPINHYFDENNKQHVFVYDLYPTNLESFISGLKDNQLNELQVRNITYCILQGLNHMQINKLAYKSFQSNNILLRPLTPDLDILELRLSGLRDLSVIGESFGTCQSPTSAPETLNVEGATLNAKQNIFELGTIIIFMLTKQYPFLDEQPQTQLSLVEQLIGKNQPHVDRRNRIQHFCECSTVLADLLGRMLCWEVKDRFTAADCLQHPFFS